MLIAFCAALVTNGYANDLVILLLDDMRVFSLAAAPLLVMVNLSKIHVYLTVYANYLRIVGTNKNTKIKTKNQLRLFEAVALFEIGRRKLKHRCVNNV